jgi:6-phosphogluconolactonase (cycloisomerase 2 family)
MTRSVSWFLLLSVLALPLSAHSSGRIELVELESTGTTFRGAAVSPDGAHVYLVDGTCCGNPGFLWTLSRDAATGALTLVDVMEGGVDIVPTLELVRAVVVSPDGRHVYASGLDTNVFSRDGATGLLTLVQSHPQLTLSLGFSPDGQHLYGSSCGSDNIACLFSVFSRDTTTGELTLVQEGTATHENASGLSPTVSPDGAHVYFVHTWGGNFGIHELGNDQVRAYSRDQTTGSITLVQTIMDSDVGGKFHLDGVDRVVVTPDGAYVYVTSKFGGDITVFRRAATTGMLQFVSRLVDGAPGVEGISGPRDVVVSPDGRHLYVQTDDGIAVLSRDRQTGALAFAENTPEIPGDFLVMSADGQSLYARVSGLAVAVWGPRPSPCTDVPESTCRVPPLPETSRLVLKDQSSDGRDSLSWVWSKGQATPVEDFGDPVALTDYTLCIYDRSGPGGTTRLVLGTAALAGGSCGSKPCWSGQPTGWKYSDPHRSPDGVKRIKLKAGGEGTASARATGSGSSLGMPALPLVPPVVAQLQASNDECWEARYSAFIRTNDTESFRAKSGSPSGAFLDTHRSLFD